MLDRNILLDKFTNMFSTPDEDINYQIKNCRKITNPYAERHV